VKFTNLDSFKNNVPFIRKPVNRFRPKEPDPIRRILPINPIAPTVPRPKLPKMR
jgi:hypothetical protein